MTAVFLRMGNKGVFLPGGGGGVCRDKEMRPEIEACIRSTLQQMNDLRCARIES